MKFRIRQNLILFSAVASAAALGLGGCTRSDKGSGFQTCHIHFAVEVACIAQDCPVFHGQHMRYSERSVLHGGKASLPFLRLCH